MLVRNIALALWRAAIESYPQRIVRVFQLPWLKIRPQRNFVQRCLDAPFEWVFVLGDLLFIPEIYCTLGLCVKWNSRSLSEEEMAVIYLLNFHSIDLDSIHIDDAAVVGPSWSRFAYVSFYSINYYGDLSLRVFAHELIHLWQFQKFGSVYIYHSLVSQWSRAGYDYGGYSALKDGVLRGSDLLDFNFEQQGDILADYYRVLHMNKRGVVGLDERITTYKLILSPLLG